MRGELTADQRIFNYHISKIRIRVEHAIGLLKGRFQSLKELRIQITYRKHHMCVLIWLRGCIILHNLIIRIEEGNVDEDWREELYEAGRENQVRDDGVETDSDGDDESEEAELRRARRRHTSDGQRFRRHVMDSLFDSPHTTAVRRN